MTIARIDSVEGNTQRLDGGSMFGNCPRAVWERWLQPDELHRVPLACRSMMVRETGGRTILFESGIGSFFPPKLRERYGVQESEHVLLTSLSNLGVEPEDVDVIVLSHLHFDHAGGLLVPYEEGASPQLAFPNAAYVVGKDAWDRALHPHPRDRASFIPELPGLLEATGKLECTDAPTSATLGDGYSFTFSNGHTPGLMLTRVEGPEGPVTYMGDLIPGTPWVHLPITMGYDRYPELIINEKKDILERIVGEDGWLFYTHDAHIAASRVELGERGKYGAVDSLSEVQWQA